MHVAVIGGTRHLGPFIVRELLENDHRVSVFNRGRTPVDLPEGVARVVVDRSTRGPLGEALRQHRPDAVIDMIGFRAWEVEEVADALPAIQHYVFCSSTAVYGVIGSSTPGAKCRRSAPTAPTPTESSPARSSSSGGRVNRDFDSPVCDWLIPTDRGMTCCM